MTEDEIELAILCRYIEKHKAAELANPEGGSKCARELDMRGVIAKITGESGKELDYSTRLWYARLVPDPQVSLIKGPLRPCSNSLINKSKHRYHARAFIDSSNTPAWDRVRELHAKLPLQKGVVKELEQKFRILYSAAQVQRDFDLWVKEASGIDDYFLGLIYIDVDDFKRLNTKFTESVVDRTLLPDLQKLIRGACLHRGAAYRHGGEELVILLPNCGLEEAEGFAENLRSRISSHKFPIEEQEVQMTVSIGVAVWPIHGDNFEMVIERANRAEREAKESGKNSVRTAKTS